MNRAALLFGPKDLSVSEPVIHDSIATSGLSSRVTSLGIVLAGVLALFLKAWIALTTFGTNDVITFYQFASALSEHGLEWTYRHYISFNHPPLTAYYLRWIYQLDHLNWFRENGFPFPFLLRLPGIIADFVVVLLLLRISKADAGIRLPAWSLILCALSPVSLMVSGFHGNSDSVMVMFFVLTAWMCLKNQPWLGGLFFALTCQIKIIPLLFFPVLFFFWLYRRALWSFLLPFAFASLVLWSEPLLKFPMLFLKNVLSYGSFWGLWGLTYWLRLTGWPAFSTVTFFNFPPAEMIVVTMLKAIIIGAVLLIAWRRRALSGPELLNSLAYAWLIFFVLSPGVCAQYMVWLAPFILLLSPTFYAWLTATSSLFLFFFYNTIAHGLPWYLAISTNELNLVWTPWTIWPWAVLIAGMMIFWNRAVATDPTLRLLSFKTLPPTSRDSSRCLN